MIFRIHTVLLLMVVISACVPIAIVSGLSYGKTSYDMTSRAKWRKHAEQGDPEGQYHLGISYQGIGVIYSDANAMQWLCRSAKNNYALAQNAVGEYFMTPNATWQTQKKDKQDETTNKMIENDIIAYSWFKIAAHRKNPEAKENLSLLSKRLSYHQFVLGKKLIKNYPNIPCEI